jgi:hypothetical protein
VTLERDGPDGWAEVEEAGLADAEPVRQVASVGQRRRQADQTDLPVRVGRDEVGPGHDHLQHLHAHRECQSLNKTNGWNLKGQSHEIFYFFSGIFLRTSNFFKSYFQYATCIGTYAFHNSTEL